MKRGAEDQAQSAEAVTGGVRVMLRMEGLALFAAAVAAYVLYGASWWLFACLFLAPDLSFIGYVAGPRFGAVVYNIAHTTLFPIALGVFGVRSSSPEIQSIALIWLAHIGIDRALGYGLKYNAGFGFTHLGSIGK